MDEEPEDEGVKDAGHLSNQTPQFKKDQKEEIVLGAIEEAKEDDEVLESQRSLQAKPLVAHHTFGNNDNS